MGPIKSEKAVEVLPSLPYPDPALAAMGEYCSLASLAPAPLPRCPARRLPRAVSAAAASTPPRDVMPAGGAAP